MTKLFGFLKFLALVAVVVMAVIAAGGVWLTNNRERVVDAAVSASGVKEAVAKEGRARCERAKREAQQVWDASVESGDVAEHAREIDALDAEVRELCKA